MAQVTVSLSSKIQPETGRSELLIRFYAKAFNLRAKTEIFITPEHFAYFVDVKKCIKLGVMIPKTDAITLEESEKFGIPLRDSGKIIIKERIETEDVRYHKEQAKRLEELKQLIIDTFEEDTAAVKGKWLKRLIERFNHPERYLSKEAKEKQISFFERFEECITKGNDSHGKKRSPITQNNWKVVERALKRYELFMQLSNKKKTFHWNLDTVDKDTIDDFESFLRNEYALLEDYPQIFEKIPYTTDTNRRSPKPKPRGNNTICALFNKLRAFFNWCIKKGYTTNQPFREYDGIKDEIYGTPYYPTLEERNRIADFDLSAYPALEVQRDIFIFQCLIGCRVSDLMRLTPQSIANDIISYIPRKTKGNKPLTVNVPLNSRAQELVSKYKGVDKQGRLFPFISSQRYNEDIKKIFKLCGVTRMVSVLNPVTGEEEKKSIDSVASSHMARRCFVGTLYEKGAGADKISSMSGHSYNSKAFQRYREVSEDMKRELVNLID